MYFSKFLPALHHTALFQFDAAKNTIDKQWFLNFPSLFFFPLYDAYINTVESNKLYEWELAKYLKRGYQNQCFRMPVAGATSQEITCISYLNSSIQLTSKKQLHNMQMKGIAKENILGCASRQKKRSQKSV